MFNPRAWRHSFGRKIRQLLLTPYDDETLTTQSELLLMFACRSQHIEKIILPALQAGKWVISDRFVDASYAYQGGGRQISLNEIAMLDKWIVQSLRPCLTILLDASLKLGWLVLKIAVLMIESSKKSRIFLTECVQYICSGQKNS